MPRAPLLVLGAREDIRDLSKLKCGDSMGVWREAILSLVISRDSFPGIAKQELMGPLAFLTVVRLKVEQNQLVDVFGEIGVGVDGLRGA
jgi:hypothetical protein